MYSTRVASARNDLNSDRKYDSIRVGEQASTRIESARLATALTACEFWVRGSRFNEFRHKSISSTIQRYNRQQIIRNVRQDTIKSLYFRSPTIVYCKILSNLSRWGKRVQSWRWGPLWEIYHRVNTRSLTEHNCCPFFCIMWYDFKYTPLASLSSCRGCTIAMKNLCILRHVYFTTFYTIIFWS